MTKSAAKAVVKPKPKQAQKEAKAKPAEQPVEMPGSPRWESLAGTPSRSPSPSDDGTDSDWDGAQPLPAVTRYTAFPTRKVRLHRIDCQARGRGDVYASTKAAGRAIGCTSWAVSLVCRKIYGQVNGCVLLVI